MFFGISIFVTHSIQKQILGQWRGWRTIRSWTSCHHSDSALSPGSSQQLQQLRSWAAGTCACESKLPGCWGWSWSCWWWGELWGSRSMRAGWEREDWGAWSSSCCLCWSDDCCCCTVVVVVDQSLEYHWPGKVWPAPSYCCSWYQRCPEEDDHNVKTLVKLYIWRLKYLWD